MKFHIEYLIAIKFMFENLAKELGINRKLDKDYFLELSEEEYLLIKLVYKIDLLHVRGSLNLMYSKITLLPDNLKITKRLYLKNSKIKELPKNLEVGEYLDLSGTSITTIPDDTKVHEHIYVSRNQLIKYIPEHLKNKVCYV